VTRAVHLVVNGVDHDVVVDPRTLLSDVLRHELGLTGTHVGCEQGVCGACTVLWDGRPVRSCLALAPQAEGVALETIEGVGGTAGVHPVQQALHDHHGLQCGFCTAGIVMSLVAAQRNGLDRDAAVAEALGGHACRCTGYVGIRTAIDAAWNDLAAGAGGGAGTAAREPS
jgi:aerobic-type carbon monoxide dehydrogenase small subunit (CoxS/CutS family)